MGILSINSGGLVFDITVANPLLPLEFIADTPNVYDTKELRSLISYCVFAVLPIVLPFNCTL
ncbi:hypothetical protein D3C73_686900 [compost metagenome]